MKMNLEVRRKPDQIEFVRHILLFRSDFLIGYGAFGVIWSVDLEEEKRCFSKLNRCFLSFIRAVTDPRTSRRVALKKMPNVFQSVVAARRAFREIKMLCTFRHDNVKI